MLNYKAYVTRRHRGVYLLVLPSVLARKLGPWWYGNAEF
jgi:hypothetical protein